MLLLPLPFVFDMVLNINSVSFTSFPDWLFSQVIEDPVEIIGNVRELKGFNNIEEEIKLVGFFKNAKSDRTYPMDMQWDFFPS